MNTSNSSQTIDCQSDSSQSALALDGRQVLLVEDCPDQGRLYLRFLQREGAEVVIECNGQSAVDSVRKTPNLFDAVVMDFQMPEMDGLDATRQMRALGYGGAIIAVTAFGSEELKLSWFEAGCNEFLEKPLNGQTLVSTVEFQSAQATQAV